MYSVVDAYPMSALQLGMVYHSELEASMYHDIFSDVVNCPWSERLFAKALGQVVQQFPVLRTKFKIGGRRPLQLVQNDCDLPLKVVDLRARQSEQQEVHLQQWFEEEKYNAFEWEKAPMFRIFVHRRTDESFEYCISFHHSILDGWSVAQFNRRLFDYYELLLDGSELPSVEVCNVFSHYIGLEQEYLSNGESRRYWNRVAKLTSDRQLPSLAANHKKRQAQLHMVIAEEVSKHSKGLVNLARVLGVHLQTVLLCAHYVAMYTLSGKRVVTTCVVANVRPEVTDAEHCLGLFLNALPIQQNIESVSWRSLIESVSRKFIDSMSHRYYPASAIEGFSFSEVIFNYTHFHSTNSKHLVTRQKRVSERYERSNFDLYVDFSRDASSDEVKLALKYDADVFAHDLVKKMSENFDHIFKLMIDDIDDIPFSNCGLLFEAERDWIYQQAQITERPQETQVVTEKIAECAKNTPDRVAFRCDGVSLTYRELEEKSIQMMLLLAGAEVGEGDVVAICMKRSAELLVGVLGILKAGAAYLPIDRTYPSHRVDYILEDAGTSVILTQQGLLTNEQVGDRRVLFLNSLEELSGQVSYQELPDMDQATTDRPAYLLYTSGSTGRPNGVVISHGALSNFICAAAEKLNSAVSHQNWFATTSLAFDIAGLEMFLPLCSGHTVVMSKDDWHFDGSTLTGILDENEITHMQGTPSSWKMLLNSGWAGQSGLTALVGGELVPDELADCLMENGANVWNCYGPTEATIWSHMRQCNLSSESASVVGGCLANYSQYVVMEDGNLAPKGVPGELYVGGPSLATGYWQRPALNQKKFVTADFTRNEPERLFKTGDLVRWMPSGNLEYLGRIDEQIKISGHRIEPGEVEYLLTETQLVSEAVVVKREDQPSREQLVAYVVRKDNAPGIDEELELKRRLRSTLSRRAPPYMVPSAFVVLESIPLTANKKIDRQALPRPNYESIQRATFAEAQTETEKDLLRLFCCFLNIEQIGIHDDFFSIGGNSLHAVQLAAAINDSNSNELTVADVLRLRTIHDISTHLDSERHLVQSRDPAESKDVAEELIL